MSSSGDSDDDNESRLLSLPSFSFRPKRSVPPGKYESRITKDLKLGGRFHSDEYHSGDLRPHQLLLTRELGEFDALSRNLHLTPYRLGANNKSFNTLNCAQSQWGRRTFQQLVQGSVWAMQRLELDNVLDYHSGCVNALSFNESGDKLLSGSDDTYVAMSDWYNGELLAKFDTGHMLNVFQCHFIPQTQDLQIITASRDREVRLACLHSDGSLASPTRCLAKHDLDCHKLAFPRDNPNVVLSAGEDGAVKCIDLREGVEKILSLPFASFSSISCNPMKPQEFCVAGRSDVLIRVYDRRMLRDQGVVAGYMDCFGVPDLLPKQASKRKWRRRVTVDGVRRRIDPDDSESEEAGSVDSPDEGPPALPELESNDETNEEAGGSGSGAFSAQLSRYMLQVFTWNYKRRRQRRLGATQASNQPRPINDFMRSPYHVTHALYSRNGDAILASYNDEDIYLFDTRNSAAPPLHRYCGHRNMQTVKSVNFMGPCSEYIVSGSDDGFVYIWDRETEGIVNWLHGDRDGIVNVLEPHPTLPVLATSGLDNTYKIWMPKRTQWQAMETYDLGETKSRGHFGPVSEYAYNRHKIRSSTMAKQLLGQMNADVRQSKEERIDSDNEENNANFIGPKMPQNLKRSLSRSSPVQDPKKRRMKSGENEEANHSKNAEKSSPFTFSTSKQSLFPFNLIDLQMTAANNWFQRDFDNNFTCSEMDNFSSTNSEEEAGSVEAFNREEVHREETSAHMSSSSTHTDSEASTTNSSSSNSDSDSESENINRNPSFKVVLSHLHEDEDVD